MFEPRRMIPVWHMIHPQCIYENCRSPIDRLPWCRFYDWGCHFDVWKNHGIETACNGICGCPVLEYWWGA